jgi:hypothetical protein
VWADLAWMAARGFVVFLVIAGLYVNAAKKMRW